MVRIEKAGSQTKIARLAGEIRVLEGAAELGNWRSSAVSIRQESDV